MKNAFKALSKFEKVWLILFSAVILVTTLWFSYTGTNYQDWKSILLNWLISPLSALTGVFCVVLVARGHIQNWVWGLINSITYGLIAWVGGYYGDWILNWFFFIPTQFFIWYVWKKNLTGEIGLVKMFQQSVKGRILLITGLIVSTVAFAYLLENVNGWFFKAMERNSAFYSFLPAHVGPLMDSASVIIQVVAEILLILMLAEQWPLWIATNVLSIAIWSIVAIKDPTSYAYSIPTLMMWIAFLVNSINGTIVWYKNSSKKN